MARPAGARDKAPRNTAARKQAEAAASDGITPLAILLTTMREEWGEAEQALARARAASLDRPDMVSNERTKALNHRAYACQLAEKAAPYCHARLASTNVNATVRSIGDLSTAELLALAGAGDGEGGNSAAGTGTE